MLTRRRNSSASESKQEVVYQSGLQHSTTQGTSKYLQHYIDQIPEQATSDFEMTCRDRSHEFMSAVKLLQPRQGNGVVYHQNSVLQQRSEFTKIAKCIGRDLANTCTKLEKLTMLAKSKSLFDDKPIEIQELTYIIKQDIKSLNDQIAQLQESKLATMSRDFKQVLEVRTENMKHQKNRRGHFSQPAVPATSAVPLTTLHAGSVLLQDEASHGGDVAINMDAMTSNQASQQMQVFYEQDQYIQERVDTMQNIEKTIVELGSVFQQLAHMVKEQEEVVQRIDSNVDDATGNIESAHFEILKHFQSVSSNRWLMIKIFAVLIVFFIVFIVFFA